MKKLVVLDNFTVDSGNFNWNSLNNFIEKIDLYDRTLNEEILERVKDANYILTCKTKITKDIIEKCENLEYIGSMATGYNHIDYDYCKQKNIVVTNAPNYSTNAVSELVFAFLFEIFRKVGKHNKRVQNGEWINSKDFCFYDKGVCELANKTIGIFGYGNIGKKVAQIAAAFDMRVLVYTRSQHKDTENIKFVSKNELLKNSDIISLHCPLTYDTKEIINQNTINEMKHEVIIVNTSRGQLINEVDLKNALISGKVGFALLDVVSVEPMIDKNILLGLKNCIITPHYGWCPHETRMRLIDIFIENLKSFIKGSPINVVN